MEFNTFSEIEQYAANKQRLLVIYDSYVLDVTDFAAVHPGGANLVTKHQSTDITNNMAGHFPLTLKLANSLAIGTMKKEIEKYIDREQPILPQIWDIDHKTYLQIIHLPHWVFQLSPKMFATPWIQKFSFCNWYNIFYVPYFIMLFYYLTKVQYNWQSVSTLEFITTALLGLLFFTFVEYSLHRFIFHSQKRLYDYKILRYLHFMTHGIHHMFPLDRYRLVLPPTFIVFVIGVGYLTVYQVLHYDNYVKDLIFWTSFLTGYCLYDSSHYFMHHLEISPASSSSTFSLISLAKKIFIGIKRHHNQHHYSGEQAGYGVSTPLWDWVLRTNFKNKRQ